MAFFNEFPHTRTYDSDLGWLIKHVGRNIESLTELQAWAAEHKEDYKELADKVDGLINNLVDIIVPWDSSIAYHIFSIVEYQGTNYIAVKDVPVGTMITNTEYWQPANTVVEQINAIAVKVSEIEENSPFINVMDYGATGDGVTDDTAAFKTAYETADENKILYIPEGSYNLTSPLFYAGEVVDFGTYPNSKLITKYTKPELYSNGQMIVAGALNVEESEGGSNYYIQGIAYNPNIDSFYIGMATGDNQKQIIYTVNATTLQITATNRFGVGLPAGNLNHINTLSYDKKRNKLYVLPGISLFYVIDVTTMTIESTHTLTEQVAGMAYDPVNDILMGVLGPNWNSNNTWTYYFYDMDLNLIRTVTRYDPDNNNIPNGFTCEDGNSWQIAYNGLHQVDYFGNYISDMLTEFSVDLGEWEGLAKRGDEYFTAWNDYPGRLIIIKINSKGCYREQDRAAKNWLDVNITPKEGVLFDHTEFRMRHNPFIREVTISGRLSSVLLASETNTEILRYPERYDPIGNNAALALYSSTTGRIVTGNMGGSVMYLRCNQQNNYSPISINAHYVY